MPTIRPSWPLFIASCTLFAAAFIATTLPSWVTLWHLWTSDGSSYSHGPLIIAVAAWLAYETWGHQYDAASAPKQQFALALLFGLGSSLVWSLGYLAGISIFQWLALPAMAAALAIGPAVKRIRLDALAPFIALYFALPVWELLVPPLQALAVGAVSLTVKLVGIPAFIEGIEVTIPGGRFIVEGGCSGVRYLLVSVALTSLWGYLHVRSTTHAIGLVLLGVAISLISNWVRIFIIVVIGYKTKMESSLVQDHEFFGWILFALSLIPIMAVALWMEKKTPRSTQPQPEISPQWSGLKVVVFLVLIAAIPVTARVLLSQIPPIPEVSIQKKFSIDAFEQTQSQTTQPAYSPAILGGWTPSFKSIENWQRLEYTPSGLQVLVGHIPKQNQTQELFSSDNSFTAQNISTQWLESTDGRSLELRNIYNQKWLARVFYRVSGAMTTGGLAGKLKQFNGHFTGRADAQLIVIGFACEDDCPEQDQLNAITEDDLNTLFK